MSFRTRITLFGAFIVFVTLLLFSLIVYGLAAASIRANVEPEAVQASLLPIRRFLILSGGLTLIASSVAIWIVAGRALQPLELVAHTAEEIRLTRDLTRRLPESRGWDELNRLARAFNGMLERLQEAQNQLTAALAAQQRFVADASHELRTPITSIRNNAGLLLGRADVSTGDREAALRDIADESERMSRLVRDLLTLARADANKHVELVPVALDALLNDIGRQSAQQHPARRVVVEAEPACVPGNPDSLKQLAWILVDNAVKFTSAGGRITLRLVTGSDTVRLEVVDDGVGLAGDADRLFERFYQVDPSRAGSGAGLGLAIARSIVEAHGGRISAANNPAHGATFSVELPFLSNS